MRLGVNVDHIATVRQQRRGQFPDPAAAALICEQNGASSIVCHLREDRRHIQDDDVRRLRGLVTTSLNLEMSIAEEIVDVALSVTPNQVTLVPEKRLELTTEGGLDVRGLSLRLEKIIPRFKERGIAVSIFVDPDPIQIEASRRMGADTIELHTGHFAAAGTDAEHQDAFQALVRSASLARELGLQVAAGHGIEYDNVAVVANIPGIEELNIGYSIIVRALDVGLAKAVQEMAEKMRLEGADAETA